MNIYVSEWINTQFVVTKKDYINFINKMASNKRKYRKTKSKHEIKRKGKKNQNIKTLNNSNINNDDVNIDGNNLITIILLLTLQSPHYFS